MSKIKWVNIHDRLPEKYVQVLTLFWKSDGYKMCMNSIQGRYIREANGNLITVYQWENENLGVTYWLDGLPELPKVPQHHRSPYE